VKKLLVLIAVVLIAMPVMAGRIQVQNVIDHQPPADMFQAYAGDSNGTDLSFGGTPADVIEAVPGVLKLVPGAKWTNFVTSGGYAYGIKSVTLTKDHDCDFIQCTDFNSLKDVSQGTGTSDPESSNIRLWWPLMYEPPCTEWTLEIVWSLIGNTSTRNIETWHWKMDVTYSSLESLIKLFHELPWGTCEVPLISDEKLYQDLLDGLAAIKTAWPEPAGAGGDYDKALAALLAFEDLIGDNCIFECPPSPAPTGDKNGITQTRENPVCCKLLVDAEYLGFKLGIFGSAK